MPVQIDNFIHNIQLYNNRYQKLTPIILFFYTVL